MTVATILSVGTYGSDDPTRASLPFHAAIGAIEAGYQPQIALLGEATYLMKAEVAGHIQGVGMPSLTELLSKLVEHQVPVYV
ncbi:MAG: hypothetical protein NVS4B2_24710 [Chloroflexota bacterium]